MAPPPLSLAVSRTLDAPQDKVFRAFTDPAAIPRWFGHEGEATRVVELDLRAGGRFVFQGTYKGTEWEVRGLYREVSIPARLVFTWQESMTGRGESTETLVTVEFRDLGGRTEIHVVHENDVTDTSRQEHEQGWKMCFDRMALLF